MKNPVQHWYHQRISAVITLFLIPWSCYAFLFSSIKEQAASLNCVHNILAMAMLFMVSIYHMILGLQIIIDDYIHHKKFNCLAKILVYIKSAAILFYAAYLFYCLLKG